MLKTKYGQQYSLFREPWAPANKSIAAADSIKISIMPQPGHDRKCETGEILWQFYPGHLGEVLVASDDKGICYLSFSDSREKSLEFMKSNFPGFSFVRRNERVFELAIRFFHNESLGTEPLLLHPRGTPFQQKIWQRLLLIPRGQVVTYGDIASKMGNPGLARAVGNAVGNNPIAFLIPCHRVVQANGKIGNYRWGKARKKALLLWEQETSLNWG